MNATMIRLGQSIGAPLMGLFFIFTSLNNSFFAVAILALVATPTATAFGSVSQYKG
jgi:hypothetical protein